MSIFFEAAVFDVFYSLKLAFNIYEIFLLKFLSEI